MRKFTNDLKVNTKLLLCIATDGRVILINKDLAPDFPFEDYPLSTLDNFLNKEKIKIKDWFLLNKNTPIKEIKYFLSRVTLWNTGEIIDLRLKKEQND